MSPRKRLEVILLEEVIHAHPEEFGDEAYMIAMIEPVQKMDAFAGRYANEKMSRVG